MVETYPVAMLDWGIAASGVYRILIDETGTPQEFEVLTSSGYREFDAAMDNIWRVMEFSPAIMGGKPVSIWTDMPISWQPPSSTTTSSATPSAHATLAHVATTSGVTLPHPVNPTEVQRAIRNGGVPGYRFVGTDGRREAWALVDEDGKMLLGIVRRVTSGKQALDVVGFRTPGRAGSAPA